MVKKIIFAVSSGLLAGLVSFGWSEIFQSDKFTGLDYSSVISVPAIFISCLIGTIMATFGHWGLVKFLPRKIADVIFGFLFSALSTASLISVLLFNVGDKCADCDPIAFWGYAMPMHFFPFLAWYTLKPLFENK
jgi:hypothetical protein